MPLIALAPGCWQTPIGMCANQSCIGSWIIPVTCAPLGGAESYVKPCLSIQLFEFAHRFARFFFPCHFPCRVQSHDLVLRHNVVRQTDQQAVAETRS